MSNDRFKFKAWDGKRMHVDGFNVGHDGQVWTFSEFDSGLKEVDWLLIQSTGLKDKNGVLIFEGDLLMYEHEEYEHPHPYVMNYVIDDGVNSDLSIGEVGFSCEDIRENYLVASLWKDMEIIGNIHQNPELLEGEN